LKILSSLLFFLLIQTVWAQPKNPKECDLLINQGIEKMYHKEHAASLELLVQAKSAAENNNWTQQNFRATNNIGANYYMMIDFGEALKYYLEAYEIAEKSEDTKNIMTVLNNIAILYFQERNIQKPQDNSRKATKLADNKGTPAKKGF